MDELRTLPIVDAEQLSRLQSPPEQLCSNERVENGLRRYLGFDCTSVRAVQLMLHAIANFIDTQSEYWIEYWNSIAVGVWDAIWQSHYGL